ncbi:hypothetical protein NPIL_87901 [Nephila pilipes]|uniref:Uncharacterized protein n=1 Tax=Nephila pilipes TaxID=299642 RepID=A0A8X6TS40_NEPPI|nr:hypothetical protein NPIL_87901 [Nephila pilipes]
MLAASRARPYLRAVRLGGLTTGTKGQRPLLRYFCALWAAYDRNSETDSVPVPRVQRPLRFLPAIGQKTKYFSESQR